MITALSDPSFPSLNECSLKVDRYRDQVAPVPRRAKRVELNEAAVPDFVGSEEEFQEALGQLR